MCDGYLVKECKQRGLYWAGGGWCDWVRELAGRTEQLQAENEDLHWRCGTESELTEHIESLQNKYAQATAEIENLEKHQQYLLSVLEDYAAVTGMDPAQVLAKRKEASSDD